MTAERPLRELDSLQDLPGVLGSFVCSTEGELLSRNLPAYFDAEALGEVGPRAARILESWSLDPQDAECILRFEEHKLYLRGVQHGILCMVVAPEVHVPSMRTAAGMVARKLNKSLAPSPPETSSPGMVSSPGTRSAPGTEPAPGAVTSTPPEADAWATDPPDYQRASSPTPSQPPPLPADRSSAPGRPPRAAPGSPARAKRVRVYRGQRFES